MYVGFEAFDRFLCKDRSGIADRNLKSDLRTDSTAAAQLCPMGDCRQDRQGSCDVMREEGSAGLRRRSRRRV